MASELVVRWLATVHPSWLPVLESVNDELDRAAEVVTAAESSGACVLPAEANVLRALTMPMTQVRVLIVGQDPYPTPGHAVGLAFSVDESVRPIPGSLRNVFRELRDDLGCATPDSGDLSAWANSGVMLLNRVLTVQAGDAGSMRGCGWEEVTLAIVRALAAQAQPPVVILWGADAAGLAQECASGMTIVSAHPSPLSARRGFFGSRPFSRANELLERDGRQPVDWGLPSSNTALW